MYAIRSYYVNSVDLVVIFEEDTPEDLISTLKPDVLAKGADYTLEKVIGRDIVKSYGGRRTNTLSYNFV